MRDEETNSLWDHITGECFDGPIKGHRLDVWHVHITNAVAELDKYPQTILLQSNYSLISRALGFVAPKVLSYRKEGTMLPPHFRHSMSKAVDPRLPEGEQGLGLVDEQKQAKFYPVKLIPEGGEIRDEWLGRPLRIERNALDGVPFATWMDTNEAPMQLLSRWYGFPFTYPDCELYTK